MRLQTSQLIKATISAAPIGPREFSVSPRAPRRQRARLGRRRRLIAAAAELFSRHGYKRTALREIATAAGCAESTIGREFGGKLGLLEALVRGRACATLHLPNGRGRSGLREDICQITEWEVNRMRRQRESVEAFLPWDASDPIVTQLAGKLSLSGSTEVISERLRHHPASHAERQFLLCTIQAVGFALGWTGSADRNQVRLKVKQVATTLAAGIDNGRT